MMKTLNRILLIACLAMMATTCTPQSVFGQIANSFEVNESVDTIEIITGSSRRLTFDYDVPELMVENPEVIKATAMSSNQILITGLKAGVSTINVSDANQNVQTISVHVVVDVRKLEKAIAVHYPNSLIKVHALQSGIVLSGHIAKPEDMTNVVAIAKDYFPTTVINKLQVQGAQTVAIKVKVYEVSRSKLRSLGIDWAIGSRNFSAVNSISDLIQSVGDGTVTATGQDLSIGVIDNNGSASFNAFLTALEQNNLAKLLDQPVLVAQNGRPAEFLSGGEIPIAVASGLGTTTIEFRPFGTKLDLVPIVHGGGEVTLEVRAEVSEIANDLSGDTGVPGFRVRRVNTGVRMKIGHTLALAGDYREEVESEVRGIPKLMDGSIWGPLFRNVQETKNETELVFVITPRFIEGVEGHQVPRLGPGRLTQSPSDRELYINGYNEVPRCREDCPISDRFEDTVVPVQQNLLPGGNHGGAQQFGASQFNGPVNNGQIYGNANGSNGAGYAEPGLGTPSVPGTIYPQSNNVQPGGSFGYPQNRSGKARGFAWPKIRR